MIYNTRQIINVTKSTPINGHSECAVPPLQVSEPKREEYFINLIN